MTELPENLAARALAGAGIASLEDLARHTERQALELHGVGPKAFGILEAAMAEKGLAFAKG